MSKTRKEHRDKLEQMGAWDEFVEYRSSLIMGKMNSIDANFEAVKKYLGAEAAETAGESGNRNNRNKVLPGVSVEEFENASPIPANTNPDFIGSIPPPPLPVKATAFKNKKVAGEIENITWVADNMRMVGVSPRSCPSKRAWNLLCECRENAFFRTIFWKTHYEKTIPAKATLTDKGDRKDIDGTPTLGLISKLQAMKEKSEELPR